MSQQFLTLGGTLDAGWDDEREGLYREWLQKPPGAAPPTKQMGWGLTTVDISSPTAMWERNKYLDAKSQASSAEEARKKAEEAILDRLYKPSNYDLPQGTPSLFAAYGLGDEEGLDSWLSTAVKKVSKIQLPRAIRKAQIPKALRKIQLPKAIRKIQLPQAIKKMQPLKIIPKGIRTEIGEAAKRVAMSAGSSYMRGLFSPKAVALAQSQNTLLGGAGWGQKTLAVLGKVAKSPFTLASKSFKGLGSILGGVGAGAAKGISKAASLLNLPAGKSGEQGLLSYLVKDVAGKAVMVVAQDKLGEMVGTKYPAEQVQELYDSLPGNQPVAVPQEAMEPMQAPPQMAGSPWPAEAGFSSAPQSEPVTSSSEERSTEPSLRELLAKGEVPQEDVTPAEETPEDAGEVVESSREGPEDEEPAPETLEAQERIRRWDCQDARLRQGLLGRIAGARG